jgi:hypothetical protein
VTNLTNGMIPKDINKMSKKMIETNNKLDENLNEYSEDNIMGVQDTVVPKIVAENNRSSIIADICQNV